MNNYNALDKFRLSVFLVLLLSSAALHAQQPFIPKDPVGEKPADSWSYLPNQGQVFDLGGSYRGDVHYMSVSTFPTLFMLKNNRIAVAIPELDTANAQNNVIHRIDLSFGGPKALSPTPSLHNIKPHIYNFFEQDTPQGVTGVKGGKRVIYENMYPKIDLHVTSNKWGPKLFIVVRPGGNPNDIELLCQGQDSLKVDTDGYLKLYFDTKFIKLTQGLAYQQDGEDVQLLTWEATYEAESDGLHVNINFDDYNHELPLIFMIRPFNPDDLPAGGGGGCDTPEWSTYLGGSGDDAVNDFAHDNDENFYYTGRSSSGSGIPVNTGASQQNPAGLTDAIIGRGNKFYELRTQDQSTWCTFFGGAFADEGRSVVFDEVNDRLVVGGNMGSGSNDFPNFSYPGNSASYNRSGGSSPFLAFFDKSTGIPFYLTRLPGDGITSFTDVDVDAYGNTFVTTGGFIALENEMIYSAPPEAYRQYQTGGGQLFIYDGFILKLDATANITWGTVFGGPGDEMITTCKVDRQRNLLYVAGWTTTPNDPNNPDVCLPSAAQYEFPLCGSGTQYMQGNLNGYPNVGLSGYGDGFVAMFDLTDLSLGWSTYFGSTSADMITDITTNSQGEVFIVGTTDTGFYGAQCPSVSLTSGFPNCDAGGFYISSTGGRKHFISRFETGGRLTWSTVIGDNSPIAFREMVRVTVDENDNTILFGSTNFPAPGPGPITTALYPAMLEDAYYCPEHNDVFMGPKSDCYLAMFAPNTELLYGTYFGGIGNDYAGAVIAFDGRIYIGGTVYAGLNFPTHVPTIPGHEPYLDDLPNAQLDVPDGFMAQLRFDYTIGLEEIGLHPTGELVVYPNPTNGQVTFVLSERIVSGRIDLFDSVGRLVLSQSVQGVNTVALDITPLAKGSYTALVHTGQRTVAAKILRSW